MLLYPCPASHSGSPPYQGYGVHHALNPDPYRGVFGNDGPAYARDLQVPSGVGGAGLGTTRNMGQTYRCHAQRCEKLAVKVWQSWG